MKICLCIYTEKVDQHLALFYEQITVTIKRHIYLSRQKKKNIYYPPKQRPRKTFLFGYILKRF